MFRCFTCSKHVLLYTAVAKLSSRASCTGLEYLFWTRGWTLPMKR